MSFDFLFFIDFSNVLFFVLSVQSVEGSQDVWFINFYSPQCSHCHDLAPVVRKIDRFSRRLFNIFECFQWREISKILEGVVRIGAVNCQDEWMMCNEQGIQAFPTLRIYPKVKIVRVEQNKNKNNVRKSFLARRFSRASRQRNSRSLRDEFCFGNRRSI